MTATHDDGLDNPGTVRFVVPVRGYEEQMSEPAEPCAFPPCAGEAVRILRLDVDGRPTMMATCESHVDWLQRYAADDAAVRIVEAVPDLGRVPVT